MTSRSSPASSSAEALPRLFAEAYPKLLALVRWRSTPGLAAKRDPEDILQASYLTAQKRWEDFQRSGMSLYSWFCRIVLNTLFDDYDFHARHRRDYRDEQAWPDGSSVQADLGLKSPGTSPSEAAHRNELEQRIESTLATLSPEHQEIMTLVHFGGLSREQAAETLGIEGATARQRYARARVKFREVWKAQFGEGGFEK
ncbi:MAG: RNA polymerase sigma factor [Gemmataceae bacterium]